MAKYAKNTTVTISKSKTQIEDLITNWGIEEFFFARSSRGDGIGFKHEGKMYKFNVTMPDRGRMTERQYEQAIRQRWRIFYMSLKMKLEEIDGGGETFEDQFLSKMCLPDGSTVGDFMRLPENIASLEKTEMPKLLT
ncbi:hypothetical protein LCGC14_0730370 [marine sediment metagenome]|uniref:Uncharacterized protein n=1 Tax=marine sediment metagenome TaxID=412755 RepID=A0A0F9QDU1_9ZZZZ